MSEQKDRPDREKIAVYLWAIVSSFAHTFQGKEYRDWDKLPQEGKELVYPVADKIIALFSDIEECNQLCCDFIAEEAKREEGERIEGLLDVTENELGFCEISNHIPFSSWQALKGGK